MIFCLYVSIIGYAQEDYYKFNNMFSISVSKDLELRKDEDAYTRFLKDTLNYVSKEEIVFQQKNLSNKKQEALNHYCRIIMKTYKDESCPFPSSDEIFFSDDFFNELLSTAPQELAQEQYFVIQPRTSIESTYSGATYVKIHYTRTGLKGNVSVNICYFFNYDCAVKAIFSYRESEEGLWKEKLLKTLKSFTWESTYTFNTYSQEDIIPTQDNNDSNSLLFDIAIGILITAVFFGTMYYLMLKGKKKHGKD